MRIASWIMVGLGAIGLGIAFALPTAGEEAPAEMEALVSVALFVAGWVGVGLDAIRRAVIAPKG